MVPASVLASVGASAPTLVPTVRELMRTKPAALPSDKQARDKLVLALDNYLESNKKPAVYVANKGVGPNNPAVPTQGGLQAALEVIRNPNKFAAHGPSTGGADYDININPNADRAIYAHELGHIASKQGGNQDILNIGKAAAQIRDNAALNNALLVASLIGPGAAAALIEGEDDLGVQLGLAAALNAPQITDEVMATKNALHLMNTSGMRANMGQRGKLAGGLLTYMTLPLILGSVGGATGNTIEQMMAG